MIRSIIFGSGPITRRLRFDFWGARLERKMQDLWIGAFWKTTGHTLELWLCLVPCFPLHLVFVWHDPVQ